MSKLVCHCCGASSSPDGSSSFVKCSYCGSSISVAEFFKSISSNSIKALEDAGLDKSEQKNISRLFKNAQNYLDFEDFTKAKEVFEKILDIYPQHIESRLNSAICILYDKNISSLEKSKIVSNYCIKGIEPHQIIPEVKTILEKISYNLVTLAHKEINSENVAIIFGHSLDIIKKHSPRDEQINTYSKKIYESLTEQFDKDFSIKKERYSPSSTFLKTILMFSKFHDKFIPFGLSVSLYMKNNKKNIHPRSFDLIKNFEDELLPKNVSKIKSYKISMFGNIKEELVDYK